MEPTFNDAASLNDDGSVINPGARISRSESESDYTDINGTERFTLTPKEKAILEQRRRAAIAQRKASIAARGESVTRERPDNDARQLIVKDGKIIDPATGREVKGRRTQFAGPVTALNPSVNPGNGSPKSGLRPGASPGKIPGYKNFIDAKNDSTWKQNGNWLKDFSWVAIAEAVFIPSSTDRSIVVLKRSEGPEGLYSLYWNRYSNTINELDQRGGVSNRATWMIQGIDLVSKDGSLAGVINGDGDYTFINKANEQDVLQWKTYISNGGKEGFNTWLSNSGKPLDPPAVIQQIIDAGKSIIGTIGSITLGGLGQDNDDTKAVSKSKAPLRRIIDSKNAFDLIDQFRGKKNGMQELGDKLTVKGDGKGTVAFVNINGQPIFGVNSTALVNDADKNLARKWRDELNLGRGKDQIFFHVEGHALMRAYDKTGGKLPSKLTIYVDRISCGNCQTYLPRLTKSMGINELKMVFKGGRTAIISDGKFLGSWKWVCRKIIVLTF